MKRALIYLSVIATTLIVFFAGRISAPPEIQIVHDVTVSDPIHSGPYPNYDSTMAKASIADAKTLTPYQSEVVDESHADRMATVLSQFREFRGEGKGHPKTRASIMLRSLTDEQRAALLTFMAGLVEKNEKVVPLDPE